MTQAFSRGTAHPRHTLTARAAARHLGISDAWLSTLRSEGRGPPFIKIGSRCWYDPDDLDSWRATPKGLVCKIKAVVTMAAEFTHYRVLLPPELTTSTNGGVGELIVRTSPLKEGGPRSTE